MKMAKRKMPTASKADKDSDFPESSALFLVMSSDGSPERQSEGFL